MRISWLFITIVLAAILWGGVQIWRSTHKSTSVKDWRVNKIPESTTSVVYALDERKWLVFKIPPDQEIIRVLINADLQMSYKQVFESPLSTSDKIGFTIQYQIVDRSGNSLLDKDYSFRLGVTEFVDKKTGDSLTSAFYLEETLIPTDGKIFLINLGGVSKNASRLRMRVVSKDESVDKVVARVYYREKTSAHRLRHLWQRMSDTQKQILSRGNVYDPDLLVEEEKTNLLRWTWQPLSPESLDGDDFKRQRLYVLMNLDNYDIREPVLPSGIFIDEYLRGVISVPEQGGTVRLIFQSLVENASRDKHRFINLNWYGRGIRQRADYKVQISDKVTSFESFFEGGLIEISAPTQMVVRAFLIEPGKEIEITPEPIYVGAYISQDNEPVDFDILHEGKTDTPFRVDLRQISVGSEGGITGNLGNDYYNQVVYELLDEQNRVIREGNLQLDNSTSVYDLLVTKMGQGRLTNAGTYYFSLPATVARLRLRSPGTPVLITAYDRPFSLVRQIGVPQDYFTFNRENVSQRGWFLMRANGHEGLLRGNRVVTLIAQPRPSEDDPEALAGNYLWEDYHPLGRWRGRNILVPRSQGEDYRSQALQSTFCELPIGKEVNVGFKALDGRYEVEPTLIYLRISSGKKGFIQSAKGPLLINIYLDGQPYYESEVYEAIGEIMLPSLAIGVHRLKVLISGRAELFINLVDPSSKFIQDAGPGSIMVKRLANRLGASGLTFEYQKLTPDDEYLSARLYAPFGKDQPMSVRVNIDPPPPTSIGPYTGWTFIERLYDSSPATGGPIPVLDSEGEFVDRGQLFIIPLGSDLPPGNYRIHVGLERGTGGYLALSKITPGLYQQRNFFFVEKRGENDGSGE